MSDRTRCWWGWGYDQEHLGDEELAGLGGLLADQFGVTPPRPRRAATVDDLDLPAPRVAAPDALGDLVDVGDETRAVHAHGQAFRDVARAFAGQLETVPDLVARPREVADVERVLGWCADAGVACVPFGGGTSVVGGVRPPDGIPSVSLDLRGLARLVDLDATSRAAHLQGGATGPQVEDLLRPHGLTLRHFPQSWEFSTLGGWIATRAGGHFATRMTHIDDLVEAIGATTPAGRWESRRLPGSGAGPSPDRLLLGSEGTLGVITDAWVRVQPRPTFRAQATVTFDTFTRGARAVRALAQSGLDPANCRLLDPTEALLAGAGDGSAAVLVLGFESADHPLGPWIDRALELTADHGGACPDGSRLSSGDRTGDSSGGAGAWRQTFLRAPYLRDGLVSLGMVVETFETAITWDRFDAFVADVTEAARAAAVAECGAAAVSVRLTHAYPDGAAPYVTVIAPGGDTVIAPGGDTVIAPGGDAPVARWDAIKAAASDAILAGGGTITHHHAVGRDHRPWYEQQVPVPFTAALRAAKRAVDPAGVCNPGVLIDPLGSPA